MNSNYSNKENDHPNLPRRNKIIEQDFNSICKKYVLEGQRLKVKSFIYKDQRKGGSKKQPMPMQKPQEVMPMNLQNITEKDIKKLQYMEQMGVINEEEKQILDFVRQTTKRGLPCHPKKAQNKPKVLPLSNNSTYNTPIYNGQTEHPQYYGHNQHYNGQFNGPSQGQYMNYPQKMNNMQNPQQQQYMMPQNVNQYNQYGMLPRVQNNSNMEMTEMSQQTYY